MTEPIPDPVLALLRLIDDTPVDDKLRHAYDRYAADLEVHLGRAGLDAPLILRRPQSTLEGLALEAFCEAVRSSMPRLRLLLADNTNAAPSTPSA